MSDIFVDAAYRLYDCFILFEACEDFLREFTNCTWFCTILPWQLYDPSSGSSVIGASNVDKTRLCLK
ncbi:hypothetical protein CHS0354_024671, partial [Potamilus streckersoni]